jgi:ABC-type multidrug transport system fused ATPase/permease subunit
VLHLLQAALRRPSGCGKSTVVQLLERFYDVEGGMIALDGSDIQALNVGWLRARIGIVSQEPRLFAATVADNIRVGKPDATDAEVEAAARLANAHSFIMEFEHGYQAQVGIRGGMLSGLCFPSSHRHVEGVKLSLIAHRWPEAAGCDCACNYS